MKLYGYFRSSAAYRTRIALNLKGLEYEYVPVHLSKGEQRAASYRALNAQELVPTLIDDRGIFTQSLAIIEYLDERYPEPPLLPKLPEARARVRAIALAIACDIHPLNNLRVLQYLIGPLGEDGGDSLNHGTPLLLQRPQCDIAPQRQPVSSEVLELGRREGRRRSFDGHLHSVHRSQPGP